jgi:para-nitrobenzyl esterase
VTIFGEESGGNAVINHLAQPSSFGLYHRAVVESGAYDRGATTLAAAEARFRAVAAAAGCGADRLSCLRVRPPPGDTVSV